MTQGATRLPWTEGWTGRYSVFDRMTDDNTERGEKRGVLSTDRAQKLGKGKDADAESDRDDSTDEEG